MGFASPEAPRLVTNFVPAHSGDRRAANRDCLPAFPAYMLVIAESAQLPHGFPLPRPPVIATAETGLTRGEL